MQSFSTTSIVRRPSETSTVCSKSSGGDVGKDGQSERTRISCRPDHGVILDVEATRAIRQAEVGASRTMRSSYALAAAADCFLFHLRYQFKDGSSAIRDCFHVGTG